MRVFSARRAHRIPVPLALAAALVSAQPAVGEQQAMANLAVDIAAEQGSYQVALEGGPALLRARVGAAVDHHWLRSSDYPQHLTAKSSFRDELGEGSDTTVTCRGLGDEPELIFSARVYQSQPYATIQVRLRNTTHRQLSVQALRGLEAVGQEILQLQGPASADRVLSDSFSENWPTMKIFDLGKAPGGTHRGVGSQLIYNRESHQSFFVGALTSERFLTVIHLQADTNGSSVRIAALSADSTGTTEVQRDFDLSDAPASSQVELSLPLLPGQERSGERLLLQAGPDYHQQLLRYGAAIRTLHKARVSAPTPIGWWSWTAFYAAITEAETLANADWLSQHLRALGYRFFQVDEGYQYARGEFTSTNAVQFPSGMRVVGHHVSSDGLVFGVWTAPFEVTSRAWVYEHHPEWLVRNAHGTPIASGKVFGDMGQVTDTIYTLDTTHPGAQEYLRQTYRTLVREWGVRFIKLDFMDTTAIEGYRHRANTTALEAQRIGLQVIREAVGENVILDKDGSPMLNVVGLVDTGRISEDTAHSFEASRTSAPGIAARFYMHRNFFLNDPDAFNTTGQRWADLPQEYQDPNLSLSAAEASIALSAISGGMYEIGDDLTVLGAQPDRLALVQNADLLNMAKLGRASTPLDLLSYRPEDAQPSIFFLRETPRQSILTVFNWTKSPHSHLIPLAELGLPADHAYTATNVLRSGDSRPVRDGAVQVGDLQPESVLVLKLIDAAIPEGPPATQAVVPQSAAAGETFQVLARADSEDAPVVDFHWDFGDGTSADGPQASHVYTRAAEFRIQLTARGVDGASTQLSFPVKVSGTLHAFPKLSTNRRLAGE
jgi:hypothetical protein